MGLAQDQDLLAAWTEHANALRINIAAAGVDPIPVCVSGELPRFVGLSRVDTNNHVFFRFTQAGGSATEATGYYLPDRVLLVFSVMGFTHIAYTRPVAGSNVQFHIAPLENGGGWTR